MSRYWNESLTEFLSQLGIPELISQIGSHAAGALILAALGPVLTLALVWITRKVISRLQDRIGPNRVGPYGLFQTVADALKLLTKEDIMPKNADSVSYNLAPVLAVFGVTMSLAVIPFAPGIIGVDLNIGVLYLVALSSVGIMSALMAGWSSNNKYALLAGFRVVAQLLSYEIPMVLSMFTVVLLTGTMRMQGITEAQSFSIPLLGNIGIGWFGFLVPGAFLIYFISALAESEQTPFDLLEAESELIAGFHIEYSGMKFAMFFLAQFLNTFFLGGIAVILFLGGWQGPGVEQFPILGLFWFLLKAFAVYVIQMWIKGTFPRIRVDQMLSFAWKTLVPLVLALVLWQMIAMKLVEQVWMQYVLIFAGNIAVIAVVLNVLNKHFLSEGERTNKRAFEPASLIGTMQPVSSSGD